MWDIDFIEHVIDIRSNLLLRHISEITKVFKILNHCQLFHEDIFLWAYTCNLIQLFSFLEYIILEYFCIPRGGSNESSESRNCGSLSCTIMT